MSLSTQITLKNRGQNLVDARGSVQEFIKESDFPDSDAGKIVLAIDEALANIVEHAESEDGSVVDVNIEIVANDHEFQVVIKDRARPYDPTKAEAVDLKTHLLSGKKDGLGLHIMRKVMDEIDYRYTEKRENCLTMIRRATANSN